MDGVVFNPPPSRLDFQEKDIRLKFNLFLFIFFNLLIDFFLEQPISPPQPCTLPPLTPTPRPLTFRLPLIRRFPSRLVMDLFFSSFVSGSNLKFKLTEFGTLEIISTVETDKGEIQWSTPTEHRKSTSEDTNEMTKEGTTVDKKEKGTRSWVIPDQFVISRDKLYTISSR